MTGQTALWPVMAPTPTGKTARPYQLDCLAAIKANWEGGCNRQLAVLATGTGKSWLISHLLETIERKRLLVLVHGTRLIEQMAGELSRENPALSVQVEQAHNYADHDSDIVVASIDTVGRKGSVRLDRFGTFDAVAADEAHHSISETWTRTLRRVADAGVLLTGWTATPGRGDGKPLADLYDKVVYELGLRAAIEQGYLCRLRAIRVQTDVDLNGIKTRCGEFGRDFDTEQLVERINIDGRNSTIVSAIEDHAGDRKSILVHAANVQHIVTLTEHLRQRGHAVDGIHYQTRPGDRSGVFRRFHTGETRILVHCGICLEGFNEPRIDCAVFAKPSKSSLYYHQALGRMTRLSPETGKVDALVIDVVDVCRKQRVQTAARVFGLRDVDLLGQDVLEAATAIEQASKAGVQVQDGDTVKQVRDRQRRLERRIAKVQTRASAVDLFGQPSKADAIPDRRQSIFPWLPGRDGEYVLRLDSGRWAVIARGRDQCWAITGNNEKGEPCPERLTTTAFADPDWGRADAWVRRNAGTWRPVDNPHVQLKRSELIKTMAPRRQKPVTPAQRAALAKHGIGCPPEMTCGAASDLLNRAEWMSQAR